MRRKARRGVVNMALWPNSLASSCSGCVRQKGRPAGHGRVPCAADGKPSRWANKARNGLPDSGFLSRVRPALFAQRDASAPADAVNTLRCQSIAFTLRLMSTCLHATDPPDCGRSIVSHDRPFLRMHPLLRWGMRENSEHVQELKLGRAGAPRSAL